MKKEEQKKLEIVVMAVVFVLLAMALILKKRNSESLFVGDVKSEGEYVKLGELSEVKSLYSSFDEIKYISKDHKTYSLIEALNKNIVSIDYILEKGNTTNALNDGGSLIYSLDNGFVNKKVSIVKCHRIKDDDNNSYVEDVYILNFDPMSKIDSFDTICK